MIDAYTIQILVVFGINAIMALGLNLITGVTGQLSLGHAGFMSVGAYTAAIMTLRLHTPYVLNLLAAGVVAGLSGVVLGFPTLRLYGDYLAIATLGFGEIVRVLFLNLEITGGGLGLSAIPSKTNLAVVYACLGITLYVMSKIQKSRVGRALMAIREDEVAAIAMGVNSTSLKVQAFAVGAFFAGISGGLYAHYLTYINPNDFGFMKSIDSLSMVVLGGMGSLPGVLLGAAVLTYAPEKLRFLQNYRMICYGAFLVFMMVFRPNGLLGGTDLRQLVKASFKGLNWGAMAKQGARTREGIGGSKDGIA
ncbi:MAG TPA: branched-chain amino acid ABC transporter permease [Firmicutes bacterium]|nr:branched-chain amino acid ABC transporter permease [Bacillota bacterium]